MHGEVNEVHPRHVAVSGECLTRFCFDPVLLAQATYKRYQSEHKSKQDSLDRSQTDLKKLRRKSQGKHASKYQIKENEVRPEAGGMSGDW